MLVFFGLGVLGMRTRNSSTFSYQGVVSPGHFRGGNEGECRRATGTQLEDVR